MVHKGAASQLNHLKSLPSVFQIHCLFGLGLIRHFIVRPVANGILNVYVGRQLIGAED